MIKKGENYYYHRKSLSVTVLSGKLEAERKLIQRMLDKVLEDVEGQKRKRRVFPRRQELLQFLVQSHWVYQNPALQESWCCMPPVLGSHGFSILWNEKDEASFSSSI